MYQRSNSQGSILTIINLIFVCLILQSGVATSRVVSVYEYPDVDENFDRIYVIRTDSRTQYLRLYCREENTVSISITWKLELD